MRASSRLLVVMLLAFLVGRVSAQEDKGPDDKKKADSGAVKKNEPDVPFKVPFEDTEQGVAIRGWLACWGPYPNGGPLGFLGTRMLLSHPDKGLPGWNFVFDKCLPLWPKYLDVIQDGRALPSIERKEIPQLRGSDWGMYLAMIEAIDRSHLATLEMFTNSAAENDHVGYKHLRGKPAQYRGQIVTVKGKISRVDKWDAPRHVRTDIQHVYGTEITTEFKGEPPFAVVFTELPAAVPYNKKIDMEVTFHGYFLGHVLFAGDPKKKEKDVTSPYLIGKTLIVNRTTPVPDSSESYSYYLIAGTVGSIVCVLIVAVLLNIWARRGDRRIESQLAQVRDKHQPFSLEPAEPEPPLAEPVVPSVPPPPGENGTPAAP
jgi:hypothetical protein